jgi:hypothetical protein
MPEDLGFLYVVASSKRVIMAATRRLTTSTSPGQKYMILRTF